MTRRSTAGFYAAFRLIPIGLLGGRQSLAVPATGTWVEQGRFETLVYENQMLPFLPSGHRPSDLDAPAVNALNF